MNKLTRTIARLGIIVCGMASLLLTVFSVILILAPDFLVTALKFGFIGIGITVGGYLTAVCIYAVFTFFITKDS